MKLEFEGKEALLQEDYITTENGGRIPLRLYASKDTLEPEKITYYASIDGVKWFDTENVTHATILYAMLKKHVTEYMHYVSTGEGSGS